MEQSSHNRVYINPNFKRTETDFRLPEQIKTTHFNRYFVEELPCRARNMKSNETMTNNRKIYVNPNFINSNNDTQNQPSRSARYIESNENANYALNAQMLQNYKHTLVQNFQQVSKEQARNNFIQINTNNAQTNKDVAFHFANAINVSRNNPVANVSYIENGNILNRQLLYKSKYSLIQNNKVQERPIEKDRVNSVVTIMESQEIKKSNQEVPLSKSRYCIIRKKKRLSLTFEQTNESKLTNNLVTPKYPVPVACSNQLTCYTNSQKNKFSCKTPEKITKIKITKYKIIPVNSLKKHTVVFNENKSITTASKVYRKSNARLSSSSIKKNRFKFIKTSTPVKSSTPVSTIKVASRIAQNIGKGACSGSKVKLSKSLRAKFNVNNIPCRLFTKYGKCLRQDQGNCKYLHDKKHVSLCRKFLKGICHDKKCSLSHELTAKKMPTCYFYLNGMCTKDGCPYLHVKLSDKTKICQEFSKGYCENGDKCPYKHVNVNQKSRKLSSKNPRSSQLKNSKLKIEEENTGNCNTTLNLEDKLENKDGDCRYYKESVNSDESYEAIKPKRCKLGNLPSFIQL
ncbi:zinc finger CCCH domain-containing protein 3 [Bicyclus anynana]|uniref:Zinc finger CCCH domain-containing protein 3 n=1 Tax=Bicyclus anynana TaxID=110368 RepID=A0A6J1MQF8_BICAN|nr:zinc finger CCCH domain-containing protein 3 [Bicyclus anynana]